jgi:hypothetical protein
MGGKSPIDRIHNVSGKNTYAYAGRLLRVRLTSSRVTVFDGQEILCEHARKRGRKGQYSTLPEHVPAQHRGVDGL